MVDNIGAIKCYEGNGFKIIEKKEYNYINKKGEKKIREYYLMVLKNN